MEKGPKRMQSSADNQQPRGEEGQKGRGEPSPSDPGRNGPSRTHCASSDGTSLFAVAPASYDTHFKKRRKMSPGPGAEEERRSAHRGRQTERRTDGAAGRMTSPSPRGSVLACQLLGENRTGS
ncbi:uncharacterized [Lates japonicus]